MSFLVGGLIRELYGCLKNSELGMSDNISLQKLNNKQKWLKFKNIYILSFFSSFLDKNFLIFIFSK